MWKRWHNYNGNRGPSIGHPTLIETTVEEGYLETIPEVDSLKSKRSSGSTNLPELPFRSMPPMPMQRTSPPNREPPWSQPSPTIPDYQPPPYARRYEYPETEISPPSSPPIPNADALLDDTPVSPIEGEGPFRSQAPFTSHHFQSRLPRRAVSGKNDQATLADQAKQETRWDAYSGEPTKDGSGLPASARPGVQPLEHQYPDLKERTKQILAGIRERDAATWGKRPPPVDPADPLDNVVRKEPWKGASGRTTLVDPVQNNPSARAGPIHYPQRNISRMKQEDVTVRPESPTQTLRTVASEESIKPVAPLKIATKSRNPSPQSSNGSHSPLFVDATQSAPPIFQHPKSLQSPFSSPGQVRYMEDIPAPLVSARAETPPHDAAPDTPRTPTPPVPYQNTTPMKMQQMPSEPDVSRFSWTTYATSVADSPGNLARIIRSESPPPVPQIPKLHIKKRPVSGTYSEDQFMRAHIPPSPASTVPRKPVGSKARRSSVAPSQLSLSKTLPQIPPEMEARDKVTNLEAQLDALSMRKHNTSRIIRDLNESLKKNAIVYDLWKRKDVAEKIANQETEMQSITNEEHEIRIALHRAQKKRDSEASYEVPTGLWIRRVTS